MRRRSATTRLILKASRVIYDTVGVLSDPERGAFMHSSGTASRRVALWITRAASYRSEFVIVPLIFVNGNKSVMVSGGQGCRQTRL